MATPTVVQHKAISNADSVGLWVGTLSNGGTLPIRLQNGTQAGNCLLLGLTAASGSIPTLVVSDDKGNTWLRIGPGIRDAAAGQVLVVYRALAVLAGTRVISIQNSTGGGMTTFQAVATEFNNIALSSADDGNASSNATSATVSGGSLTLSTANDLIWMVMFRDTASAGTTYTAGSQANIAWSLLSADTQDGMACQWGQYASTTTFTPQMTMASSSKSLAVSVALKTADAGAPRPAGLYIAGVHHLSQPRGISNPFVAQVPMLGNLLVATFSSGDQTYRISSVADNTGGTWQSTGAFNASQTQDTSQHYYLENVSPNQTRRATITYNTVPASNDATVVFYDIAGAKPTGAFDKRGIAVGKMVSTGEFPLTTPTLTPAATGGVVIANIQYQFNTANGATSAGAIFDAINYTGENNDGPQNMDQNGGWAHVYPSSLAAVSFTWAFTTTQILDTWTAYASSWLAAPVVVSSPTPAAILIRHA